MTIGIVRTNWSGTSGGPGLTQFAVSARAGDTWSASDAQSAVNAVRAFWNGLSGFLPNELSLQVQSTVDEYDQATGLLSGTIVAGTTPTVVNGTATGNYAGGAGYKVTWETNSIRNGKRVRGRTYIVPAAASAYDLDGTLTTTCISGTQTQCQNMLTALSSAGLQLVVWSRPGVTGPATGAITGVQSGIVKDKSAILRGRRD